jgi:hypothetical protein
MEQVASIPLNQQDGSTNPSLTLEQARERMVGLLSEGESNAWEIGDLLNAVEKQGLARRAGYGKTRSWLAAEVPGAEGKTSTLYRYATVADLYTKQHVKLWGVSKLELLVAHDRGVLGHSNPEDPVNRDVQLLRPDGSTVIKKFHDCSYRDLQLSSQLRRKAEKASGQKDTPSNGSPGSQTEGHSFRVAFAMMALGILLCTISQFLPTSIVSVWIFIAGAGCFFGGIGILIRHWENFRERLMVAVKAGKALEFLKEQLDNAGRGAQKVALAIRSRMKATKAPNAAHEETPTTEKKAA